MRPGHVLMSEFRNNLSECAARVRSNGRPILLTQYGRAASYLVDAESLNNLFDRLELSRDIEISRREFAEGKGIPSDEEFNRLHEKLLAMENKIFK